MSASKGLIANVCPRCGNGRPTCADKREDGSHYYSHADTCATYKWADDVCDGCKSSAEYQTETGLPTPATKGSTHA